MCDPPSLQHFHFLVPVITLSCFFFNFSCIFQTTPNLFPFLVCLSLLSECNVPQTFILGHFIAVFPPYGIYLIGSSIQRASTIPSGKVASKSVFLASTSLLRFGPKFQLPAWYLHMAVSDRILHSVGLFIWSLILTYQL